MMYSGTSLLRTTRNKVTSLITTFVVLGVHVSVIQRFHCITRQKRLAIIIHDRGLVWRITYRDTEDRPPAREPSERPACQ